MRRTRFTTSSTSTFLVLSLSYHLLLSIQSINAFYLPGVVPISYQAGDEVPFSVNALQPAPDMGVNGQDSVNAASSSSQLKSLIGLDYYHEKLHFCQPQGGPKAKTESLGSALLGDRIYSSPMKAHMLKDESCVKICEADYPTEDSKFVNERILEGFAVNWMIDGLPVAKLKVEDLTKEKFYSIGFPLGNTRDAHGQPLSPPSLNNHFEVVLEYHKRSENEFRVVGATIWPNSRSNIKHKGDSPDCSDLNLLNPIRLKENGGIGSTQTVAFTMSTHWVESKTSWATRWDHYLRVFDPKIHWFSLVNSIVIVSFLCVMVAMILVRSVSRDISRYNAIDLDEDVQEDFGWKLVHGEVFRPPQHPMLLSIMVGTGSQLTAMSLVTLFFALLGFLSPSNRGSLATVMIVAWTLFGALAGYMSARVYASLNGDMWKRNVFGTAVLFPTVIFASVNLLNFFLLVSGSSGAVPFGSLAALVALWFLINVPLTLLGSFVGIKQGGWRNPVSVSPIPRQIPPKVWYLRTGPSAIIAGILPFGAAFLELFFVLNSIFSSKVYYAFGFLALTFCITALTTATVTILFCYFTLCAEEYRWHWRAFLTGGGSAFWVFAYGLFYWTTRLELPGLANKVLYLGYLGLISLLDFILFGFIGWFACYMAVRRIYSQVRID